MSIKIFVLLLVCVFVAGAVLSVPVALAASYAPRDVYALVAFYTGVVLGAGVFPALRAFDRRFISGGLDSV